MRFGCCVRPEQIEVLANAGFDYCELPAKAVLPFESDTTVLPVLKALENAPLRPEAFNLLVPAELPLVGPNVDLAAVDVYLQRAFSRMAQVGAEVAVLGSGAARRIPENYPRERALDQLAIVLDKASELATQAGISLALEHLNRDECNVFTSLGECYSFIEEHSLNNLHLIADSYHLEKEQEPLAHVKEAAALLVHAHTAAGKARLAPGSDGSEFIFQFVQTLQEIGYNARISVECNWQDLETQAAFAQSFMRKTWEESN